MIFLENDTAYQLSPYDLTSEEKVPDGTVRNIVDRLFYSKYVCSKTDWIPVDQARGFNEFKKTVLKNNDIKYGEFILGRYDIVSRIKAKPGDIMSIGGELIRCQRCYRDFFVHNSTWTLNSLDERLSARETFEAMLKFKEKIFNE